MLPGGSLEAARAWGSLGQPGAAWGSFGQPGAAWGSLGQPRAGRLAWNRFGTGSGGLDRSGPVKTGKYR